MGARHQPSQKRQVSAATVVVSTQRKAWLKATLCTRTSPDDSQSFKNPPVVGVLPSRALVSSSVRPHVQLYCADTVPRTCFTSPPKPASSCNPRHAHTHVTTRCRATHSEAPGPSSRRCPRAHVPLCQQCCRQKWVRRVCEHTKRTVTLMARSIQSASTRAPTCDEHPWKTCTAALT